MILSMTALASAFTYDLTAPNITGQGLVVWEGVGISGNGQYMLGGQYSVDANPQRLYLSDDYGVTWTETQPRGDVNGDWYLADISETGQYMIAYEFDSQTMYYSDDYGSSWSLIHNGSLIEMKISADGQKIFYTPNNVDAYLSTNAGNNFSQMSLPDPNGLLQGSIDFSDDFNYLIAVVGSSGLGNSYVFYSDNGGSAWNNITPSADQPSSVFVDVAISNDGQTMTFNGLIVSGDTQIRKYYTLDGGSTIISTDYVVEPDAFGSVSLVSDDGLIILVSHPSQDFYNMYYEPNDQWYNVSHNFSSSYMYMKASGNFSHMLISPNRDQVGSLYVAELQSLPETSSPNSPPVIDSSSPVQNISMNIGSSQDFSVSVSDADNDTLTYVWVYDDIPKTETSNSYYYVSELGNHTLEVVVTDGEDNVNYEWNIEVIDNTGYVSQYESEDVGSVAIDFTTAILIFFVSLSSVMAIYLIFSFAFGNNPFDKGGNK